MTSNYFERAVIEWSQPPVDDIGYLQSCALLGKDDDEVRDLISRMREIRYDTNGWRNHRNLWRSTLGHDTTSGKTILDFGCGVGLEALEFARAGNDVYLADITLSNVALAWRVMGLFGEEPKDAKLIEDRSPFVDLDEEVDIFYANGVVHHIPYADDVMEWASTIAPEARLMLYSDRGWLKYVGEPLPEGKACDDPRFRRFVRTFDLVGEYADFYTPERIEQRWGKWWDIESFTYICDDDRYCTVILKRRN